MGVSEEYQALINDFITRYLSREEVMRRLPLHISIQDFYPDLLHARRQQGQILPLMTQEGKEFWFTVNPSITCQVDRISAAARRENVLKPWVLDRLQETAVIEEAVFSSMIEGAFTTRDEAERMLKNTRQPRNKSEQMVKNNYDALNYVLEHLHGEITMETLIQIAGILTKDASEKEVTGYRTGQGIVAGQEGLVYTPPPGDRLPEMMDSLIKFMKTSSLHPVLKACIAHFYFVYVHPFSDGNGRTARALSLMILLQAGFDFFRTFPISGLVAKERGKYYKAIRDAENADGDMTFFVDVYSGMLSRALEQMEHEVTYRLLAQQWMNRLDESGKLNIRQLEGARWLLTNEKNQVTADAWKKKFQTVTETARQDLLLLCELGLLTRRMDGKRAVFDINRTNTE